MSKEFKSFIKAPQGGEGDRCFYPVRLESYGKGCQHNCSYCYARGLLDFRNLWDSDEPAVSDIGKIRTIFSQVFDKGRETKWAPILRNRIPLRLGGLTDPMQPLEKDQQATLALLHVLKDYEYPYLLLTKSALIGTADYLKALDPDLAVIQVSITSLDPGLTTKLERGASPSLDRLNALRQLAEAGIYAMARISPLFPMHADGHFSNGGSTEEGRRLDYFSWDLVHECCRHGAKSILVEFLRFNTFMHRWFAEDIGDDLRWMINDHSRYHGGCNHFSMQEKRWYYERIKIICQDYGVEFSVCEDGHFEECRDLWANPLDCCNAMGKVKGFQATIRSIPNKGEPQPAENNDD